MVSDFLSSHEFSMIVRAHEVAGKGYLFSQGKKLLTICSLANYCGFYRNDAAVANIDDQCNLYI